MSFATEEMAFDKKLGDGKHTAVKVEAGQVWRIVRRESPNGREDLSAFNDFTVLGIDKETGQVKVARPYVYASGVGTTGPTPLLGCETFALSGTHLVSFYKLLSPLSHYKV